MILLLVVLTTRSNAQQKEMADVLARIKSANNATTIRYDYSLQMINTKNGNVAEQFSGSGYKKGTSYLDSNQVSVSLVTKDYYFKLDKDQKIVTVAKINVLKKKMGISLNNSSTPTALLPDSVLLKESKMSKETKSNGEYWIHFTFPASQHTGIHFMIDEQSMEILKVRLEVADDAYGQGYKKVYTIYNIKHSFDSRLLDTDHYFKIRGDVIVLDGRFKGYKLDTITN